MSYYMKITSAGAAKVAAAQAASSFVELSEIAVGDGSGSAIPPPTGSETTLVNEVFRDSVANISASSSDSSIIVAEMTIPSDAGGWTVREIGLFDGDGDLFAYGNFPTTYKPLVAEGSAREMIVRVALKVGASSVINMNIDPSVVLASKQWVLERIAEAKTPKSKLFFMGQL